MKEALLSVLVVPTDHPPRNCSRPPPPPPLQAAHMCGYSCETVVISGNYSLAAFKEDLVRMYKRAGLKVGGSGRGGWGGLGGCGTRCGPAAAPVQQHRRCCCHRPAQHLQYAQLPHAAECCCELLRQQCFPTCLRRLSGADLPPGSAAAEPCLVHFPPTLQDEGIMFLLTDSQVVDERMLVFVNDLLASGEIPELFAPEDRDDIIAAMRGEAKAQGLADTNDNCWRVFIQRVGAAGVLGGALGLGPFKVMGIRGGSGCSYRPHDQPPGPRPPPLPRLPAPCCHSPLGPAGGQEPAYGVHLLPRGRCLPRPLPALPGHRQLHRHRLVPPLVGGCRCRLPLPQLACHDMPGSLAELH